MSDATFARPDLTTFAGLDRLGLEVTGQRLEPGRAVLACRVLAPDDWCRERGWQATPRDSVVRRLAHEPFGWRPTVLHVTVQRYQCTGCTRVWRQDTTAAAEPRAKLSRAAVSWALAGLVTQHLSVAWLAECLDGEELLTDRQRDRLRALFAVAERVEVEATWGIYQRLVAAYRHPDRAQGKSLLEAVIDSLATGVPAALVELRTLGRTLTKRAADVLAYIERPGTCNGPTEAINGRLEHLRGTALGFRNLTNYIAPSLLETCGFRPQLHPRLR